jgi:mannose-1-phosphate guanylyltransferase
MPLIPTLVCGGVGSRLWPVSRELHPKPFVRFPDGESLLQKAYLRAAALDDVAAILTVTNRELFFKSKDEYAGVEARGVPAPFILEPVGRGTAAAVAAAALSVLRMYGADAVVLVLPADHLVSRPDEFQRAVLQAVALAKEGRIVAFGIEPESAETGYGYIEARGTDVVRFIEKPEASLAAELVRSGRFLWNAGMFCFLARTAVAEMAVHCPDVLEAVRACLDRSTLASGGPYWQLELDAPAFAQVPETSFDYAVMERTSLASVVRSAMGWRDIGSWTAMADLVPPDASGNRVQGEVFLHDVTGCYVRGSDRVVGAVGIRDLVIVDTEDALLVSDKSRVQEVKGLFGRLKAAGHESHKLHRTVHRPWGTYTVLEAGEGFKIKRIVVKPGASLSLQMHRQRSEHWVVVSGEARVVNDERSMTLGRNESTYIPAGCRHRLANAGTEPLVMIEVQCGSYVGEDDIVRFDDAYGRAESAAR